jgi:hypothetical protein
MDNVNVKLTVKPYLMLSLAIGEFDTENLEADMGLRRLHKIHRAAMKAAHGIDTRAHPDDDL